MSSEITNDKELRWYAINTHSKQEDRANINLRVWNVETFTPRLRERRRKRYAGESCYVTKHLFPGYIFARFKVADLLHKVRFTRGVHKVVSFGNSPTPIADEIIGFIRSRIGGDGFVRVEDELKPGDQVVILGGPFNGLLGVFQRGMPDRDRVMVLLSSISYQPNMVLARDAIKRFNKLG